MIVTLDGPAGAGKTTLARALAQRLGCRYLDSGAMYRAVALKVHRQGVDPSDEAALAKTASSAKIVLAGESTLLDDEDVSDAIRKPGFEPAIAAVATCAGVRQILGQWQRRLGEQGDLVAEGRDMGTVVFPGAEVKLYVTASDQERAGRRMKELQARGENVTFADVLAAQRERDRRDRQRELAPLKPAADAITVDTTDLTFDEALDRIVHLVRERTAC